MLLCCLFGGGTGRWLFAEALLTSSRNTAPTVLPCRLFPPSPSMPSTAMSARWPATAAPRRGSPPRPGQPASRRCSVPATRRRWLKARSPRSRRGSYTADDEKRQAARQTIVRLRKVISICSHHKVATGAEVASQHRGESHPSARY